MKKRSDLQGWHVRGHRWCDASAAVDGLVQREQGPVRSGPDQRRVVSPWQRSRTARPLPTRHGGPSRCRVSRLRKTRPTVVDDSVLVERHQKFDDHGQSRSTLGGARRVRHPVTLPWKAQMTTPRRVGTETSKTRAALLDTAEKLMLSEGYAAVTYRGVASRAGVASGLVQYYFPTLDDLFLALVRRRTEQTLGMLVEALRTDHPLRALWEFSNNWTAGALITELTALANHRKKIRAEIAAVGEKVRELALEALSRSSNDYTVPLDKIPAEVLVFLVTSSPRMVIMEQSVGMSTSHAETINFVERYLDKVEPRTGPENTASRESDM